uniref:Uncharacterized protein MANES_08G155800 n=1 Tax=Rhizophora mucronata TaxID=61149 RepID=A0A2P2MP03_RHIMU
MPAPCLAWTDVTSPNKGIASSITAARTFTVIDLAIEVIHLEAASLIATWEWQTHLKMQGRSVRSLGFKASSSIGAIERTTCKLFIRTCGSLTDSIVCACCCLSSGPPGIRTSVRQSHIFGSLSNNEPPNLSHKCFKASSEPRLLIKPSSLDRSSPPVRILTFDFCFPVLLPKKRKS